MINGEGSGDKLSSTSRGYDPVDHQDEMDGEVDDDGVCCSSQYSSCGESEFDKYCSANSAMGTPSVCGSIGTVFHDFNNDSDFGSLKNFKLGDESSSIRSFRVDRKLSDSRGCGFQDGETRNNLGLMEGSPRNEVFGENLYAVDEWRGEEELRFDKNLFANEFKQDNIVNTGRMEKSVANSGSSGVLSVAMGIEEDDESFKGVEQVNGGFEGLEVLSNLEYDGGDVERCSNEGETSLRNEHSEGEDSMFGYGTDDDSRYDMYHRTKIQHRKLGCDDNENKLVMTSATAYGEDDFDDFIQETGGNPLDLVGQEELLDVTKYGSSGTIPVESSLKFLTCVDAHGKKLSDIANVVRSTNSAYSPSTVSSHRKSSKKQEDLIDVFTATKKQEDLIDVFTATSFTNSAGGLAECSGHFYTNQLDKSDEAKKLEDVKDVHFNMGSTFGINNQADAIQTSSKSNITKLEQDPLTESDPLKEDMGDVECKMEQQYMIPEEAAVGVNGVSINNMELEEKNLLLDPLSGSTNQSCFVSRDLTQDSKAEFLKDHDQTLSSSTDNNMKRTVHTSPLSYNHVEDYFSPVKTDSHELNEFFDEVVHDMEEILLDTNESPVSRFAQKSRLYQPQGLVPSRDGSSTASTSGAIDAYPVVQHLLRIDGVEVVGAKQKEGDVSLSERLVGVKKYTVYVIRVWSGGEHWDVERRYRDFCTLYRSLKKSFSDQGRILPSPWSSVEQESRKIFGSSSPDVVAERSVLIQECIRSVLHSRNFSSSVSALISFLSPTQADPVSAASGLHIQPSITKSVGTDSSSSLGKTISLLVNIQPQKSMKQLLDAQHYACAGCHRDFNDGRSRMQDLVQTLGWGKPRLCAYSGQLFCSSCHANDSSVLPARVLHYWDFTQYPVSQLAKSYLDSIYDQPMLCVSAVNPHLFLKVPTLQHVTNSRRKVSAMLPYVRCPFRGSIYKGLGSRRYLLESNDFFALRDLVDLSKGVFAALPVMIDAASKRILEHITEQCLVCYDAGVPCGARQSCDDPSSLIFPFQEPEVEKCKSCSSAFHKSCFKKAVSCPCGARFKPETTQDSTASTFGLLSKDRSLSRGLVSGLLSKVRPQVSRILGEQVPRDNNNVILMGSLPNTSL